MEQIRRQRETPRVSISRHVQSSAASVRGDTRSFTPREQLCGLPRLHSRNPNGTVRVSLDFTRRQSRGIATKKCNYDSARVSRGWRGEKRRKKSRIQRVLFVLSTILFTVIIEVVPTLETAIINATDLGHYFPRRC